jgi:hypothetical protein
MMHREKMFDALRVMREWYKAGGTRKMARSLGSLVVFRSGNIPTLCYFFDLPFWYELIGINPSKEQVGLWIEWEIFSQAGLEEDATARSRLEKIAELSNLKYR